MNRSLAPNWDTRMHAHTHTHTHTLTAPPDNDRKIIKQTQTNYHIKQTQTAKTLRINLLEKFEFVWEDFRQQHSDKLFPTGSYLLLQHLCGNTQTITHLCENMQTPVINGKKTFSFYRMSSQTLQYLSFHDVYMQTLATY